MSEYSYYDRVSDQAEEEVKRIDLIYYINEFWKKFKRLWWMPLLLALLLGAYTYLRYNRTYYPYYQTSITSYVEMSVKKSDSYQNQLTASQMQTLFPYLMSNGLLEDAICSKLGTDYLPGELSMQVDSDSNLITFYATGEDPEALHELVTATVAVFPETLSYIVGPTTFKTFKDMGVPKLPVNEPVSELGVIKASVKRGIYGYFVGLIIILIFGAMNQTVSTNKELKKLLNVPMLGIVPQIKQTKRRPYALVDDEKVGGQFVEAFRSFRNRFEREAGNNKKIFMVTSTIPNEGKSTAAVNLALSLAAKGRKVLLIDSDMRNPSIHKMLGLENEKGLHEVLKEQCNLNEALQKISEQGLYVLPAGSATKDSADLICSAQMKELLNTVRDYADYVILDTPPVMVLSDSKALAGYMDGCIYVVRKETARIQSIKANIAQLAEAGVEIVGTVFNGSGGEEGGYSRSGKYGGYGKYGKYGIYGRYGKNSYYGYGEKSK